MRASLRVSVLSLATIGNPPVRLLPPYADHELAVVLHRRGLDCVEVRVREPVRCGQLGVLGDLHAEQDQVRDVRARGVPVRALVPPLGQVPGDDERTAIGVRAPIFARAGRRDGRRRYEREGHDPPCEGMRPSVSRDPHLGAAPSAEGCVVRQQG